MHKIDKWHSAALKDIDKIMYLHLASLAG